MKERGLQSQFGSISWNGTSCGDFYAYNCRLEAQAAPADSKGSRRLPMSSARAGLTVEASHSRCASSRGRATDLLHQFFQPEQY